MLDEPLASSISARLQKNFYFSKFLFGRNAIFAALYCCKENRAKTILFPSYSCGDEISVAIKLGFKILFYDINNILELDTNNISKYLQETDILFLTHYFGIVQKAPEINRLIKDFKNKGGVVIEDAAYALFSKDVGIYGDFVVFSFRKCLPVPHGAILCYKDNCKLPYKTETPPDVLDKEIDNFNKYVSGFNKPGSGVHAGINPADQYGARYEESGGYNLSITNYIDDFIKNFDIIAYNQQLNRRFNLLFNMLYNSLGDEYLHIAKAMLARGVQSKMLPIEVSDSSLIHKTITDNELYFTVPFWNRHHPYINWDQYNGAAFLKNSIIALVVDTDIDEFDIRKVCAIIKSKCRKK